LIEFRLLGPVEAWSNGRRLSLGGPKPVALLAALLLYRGRVVPVERIVDMVWGDRAPMTVRALVASHVAALRRQLGSTGHRVIVTRSPGYAIEMDAIRLDVAAFEQAVAEHRRAAAEGRHREAVDGLAAALALWRGERALEGVAMPFAEVEAARLGELRLVAMEERFASLLALGDEADAIVDLFAQVAAYPLRERLRGELMVALYRIGRQADALRVYQEGQELLAEELGVDPGPELRALHQAVLTEDGALLGRPAPRHLQRVFSTTASTAGDRPAPSQLPADIVDFTGRQVQVAWVRRLIDSAGAGRTAVPVGVISGRAGSGKTALAVRMGHELASRFPQGQLFLNLAAESRRVEPAEALERMLRALGVEATMMPTGLEERVELYRMLLAGRRVLVVLDNAVDERQVRPLLPGAPTCTVIVTSRARLAGLEAAAGLDLDVLDEREAVTLLARIAGADRVAEEPEAAAEVVGLCGRLPLAVRIAGARLAARPYWRITRLASRLRGEHRRLDELTVGDLGVRASLGLSYLGLPDVVRTAIRRVGLVRLSDFAAWVLAPLLEIDVAAAEDLIDQLVEARLVDAVGVDATGQTRYGMHELIHLYVRERAVAEDAEEDRHGALSRMVSCWLELLDRAASLRPGAAVRRVCAGTPRWRLDEQTVAALLTDPAAWFRAELVSIVAVVEQCADLNLDGAACELASVLVASPFALYNEFDAWSRTHEAALAAVRRTGNRRGEAVLLAGIGELRYEQDRFAESEACFREALSMFRQVDDVWGEAMALTGIGIACCEQANFSEASSLLGQALAALTVLDDHLATARVRYWLGVVHREQGRYDEAVTELTAALEAYRTGGHTREEAILVRSVGLVHRARGDYGTAAELSALALGTLERLGEPLVIAYGRQALAKALLRQGRTDEARAALMPALATCYDLRDRFGEALITRTIGELHLVTGDHAAAADALRSALRQWDVLALPLWRARTLRDLGRVHAARGDQVAADEAWAEAAATFARVGSHEAAEPLGQVRNAMSG
jgi:DNA-binding SARP family transcriptional activator